MKIDYIIMNSDIRNFEFFDIKLENNSSNAF